MCRKVVLVGVWQIVFLLHLFLATFALVLAAFATLPGIKEAYYARRPPGEKDGDNKSSNESRHRIQPLDPELRAIALASAFTILVFHAYFLRYTYMAIYALTIIGENLSNIYGFLKISRTVNGARVTLQEQELDRQAVRAVVGHNRRHSLPSSLGGAAGLILVDGGALGHLSVSVHGLAGGGNSSKSNRRVGDERQWVHDDESGGDKRALPKVADVSLPHAWIAQPMSLHHSSDPTEPFRPAYPLSVLRLTSSSSLTSSARVAPTGEGFIAPTHYYYEEEPSASRDTDRRPSAH